MKIVFSRRKQTTIPIQLNFIYLLWKNLKLSFLSSPKFSILDLTSFYFIKHIKQQYAQRIHTNLGYTTTTTNEVRLYMWALSQQLIFFFLSLFRVKQHYVHMVLYSLQVKQFFFFRNTALCPHSALSF